jgi:hypothetical protein
MTTICPGKSPTLSSQTFGKASTNQCRSLHASSGIQRPKLIVHHDYLQARYDSGIRTNFNTILMLATGLAASAALVGKYMTFTGIYMLSSNGAGAWFMILIGVIYPCCWGYLFLLPTHPGKLKAAYPINYWHLSLQTFFVGMLFYLLFTGLIVYL